MKPQDIDKIANIVVESLGGGPAPGLLGCFSITSTERYYHPPGDCKGLFQCGGLGDFLCCETFGCPQGFVCPGPARFNCLNEEAFTCAPTGFTCGTDTFTSTVSFCPPPA